MIQNDLRARTVCFTGHREISHSDIAERLDTLLNELYQQGYYYFGAGGALGFDTEAALAVLRAQEKHPQIKLILVLPFPGQAVKWSAEQQQQYEDIKAKAAKVKLTSQNYTRGCFHVRNRALVDGASLCIAYLSKNTGGTAYTVDYARQQGLKVINMANA